MCYKWYHQRNGKIIHRMGESIYKSYTSCHSIIKRQSKLFNGQRRRYTYGQHAYSSLGKQNQSHNEIPLDVHQDGHNQKVKLQVLVWMLVRMENDAATVENSLVVFYNIRQRVTPWPNNLTPRYIPSKLKNYVHT